MSAHFLPFLTVQAVNMCYLHNIHSSLTELSALSIDTKKKKKKSILLIAVKMVFQRIKTLMMPCPILLLTNGYFLRLG